MEQLSKHALDGAVGGTAVSVPLWIQSIDGWAQLVVAIGGVVLIGLRICIALRDLNRRGPR